MGSIHHSFSIEYAEEYGIEEAILIHHFQHWITVNRNLKRRLVEGRTWTYQTQKEISAHFTYLNEKQIFRAIKSLVDKGVLIKGNFNKNSFDRTLWYAFNNEEMFTKLQKRKMDDPESENGKDEIEDCIDTDSKPDAETKKQQQQPSAADSVVVVFSCLKNLNEATVSDQDKERLSRTYPESIVIDAIKVVQQQGAPESFLKSLNAACKGGWKPKPDPFVSMCENRNYALDTEMLHGVSLGRAGYSTHVGPTYFEINHGCLELEYRERNT